MNLHAKLRRILQPSPLIFFFKFDSAANFEHADGTSLKST